MKWVLSPSWDIIFLKKPKILTPRVLYYSPLRAQVPLRRRTLQHRVLLISWCADRYQKLILREANTGCTYLKSPVRSSLWPPLCFIYIKNFHFQMYISPWLNNVAQGWTGLSRSNITCSTDLYVVWMCHCQHEHYSLLGGREMRMGEQGGNHLLLACLHSESWDLLGSLRCAGWCHQLKDW